MLQLLLLPLIVYVIHLLMNNLLVNPASCLVLVINTLNASLMLLDPLSGALDLVSLVPSVEYWLLAFPLVSTHSGSLVPINLLPVVQPLLR